MEKEDTKRTKTQTQVMQLDSVISFPRVAVSYLTAPPCPRPPAIGGGGVGNQSPTPSRIPNSANDNSGIPSFSQKTLWALAGGVPPLMPTVDLKSCRGRGSGNGSGSGNGRVGAWRLTAVSAKTPYLRHWTREVSPAGGPAPGAAPGVEAGVAPGPDIVLDAGTDRPPFRTTPALVASQGNSTLRWLTVTGR